MNNYLTVKLFAMPTIIARKKIKIRSPKKHLNRLYISSERKIEILKLYI